MLCLSKEDSRKNRAMVRRHSETQFVYYLAISEVRVVYRRDAQIWKITQ